MSQQPHKNHTAIPRQSHSKMSSNINIALVHNKSTTIHLAAAARRQQAHSNTTKIPRNSAAISQQHHQTNGTVIPQQYKEKTATFPRHSESNATGIPH